LTKVFYEKNCGLITACFNGRVSVYDAMDFKHDWTSENSTRKERTTISACDISKKTGLIAIGGVEGKLVVLDPSAKIVTGEAKAH
jgi:hypothetical protein